MCVWGGEVGFDVSTSAGVLLQQSRNPNAHLSVHHTVARLMWKNCCTLLSFLWHSSSFKKTSFKTYKALHFYTLSTFKLFLLWKCIQLDLFMLTNAMQGWNVYTYNAIRFFICFCVFVCLCFAIRLLHSRQWTWNLASIINRIASIYLYTRLLSP